MALGIGIMILAAGLSISIWAWQDDEATRQVPVTIFGSRGGLEIGRQVPGLQGRLTTVSGSLTLDAQNAEHPSQNSVPGDVARVQDGADLVVRDSEGNIKYRVTAE